MGASSPNAFDAVALYAGAAVPVAVLAVLIQRRLAHGAVAGLVVELGGPGPGTDPKAALTQTQPPGPAHTTGPGGFGMGSALHGGD